MIDIIFGMEKFSIISEQKNNKGGHRSRLRQRVINNGISGLLDYEIIELLLTFGTPRRDCKNIAKDLLSKFKSLNSVLNAKDEDLFEIKGVGPKNSFAIKLFRELHNEFSKREINTKVQLNSSEKIYQYLLPIIGYQKKEHFVVLCLDVKNNLILDEVSVGTLNSSLVHPREVFKVAIMNNANTVVVAHNHPSGDPTPSEADILTTSRLIEAGKILGISVIDHIIVAKNGFKSLNRLDVK